MFCSLLTRHKSSSVQSLLNISSATWLYVSYTSNSRGFQWCLAFEYHVVLHVDGGWLRLWTAATNGPVVIPQMPYEYGEPRWTSTDSGKPKNSEESLFQYHFVRHKSYMDWPGRESGLSWWEAAINRLSHDTALEDHKLILDEAPYWVVHRG
jgi:hypothetical protein